jgi:glycosyltransferase involved in cell wall biosynthesis
LAKKLDLEIFEVSVLELSSSYGDACMVNTKPKVSIGLPVYNAEKYLEEALDSIVAQTYTDFELIISDNASTDRTQEICLKYAQKDPRIRYYRNEKNLGGAPNYNYTFQLAKGEYFKWAAYDDNLAPEFLSRCVEALDQKPDIILSMTETKLIDEHGKRLRNIEYGKADGDFDDPKKRFRNFLLYNMSGNFLYSLIRTDVMAQTMLHGNFTSADLVFQAELTLYGRYYVVPEYLFLRRDHPEQSTKGIWKSERARAPWFDTSLEGKIVLPKWLFLFKCLKAIKRAPLNGYDRIRCYACMIEWILLRRTFWALWKDIFVAVQKFIYRTSARRKQSSLAKSNRGA